MIIISGPSTVGKNPFIYRACELYGLNYVTPYTTRTARSEEKNGEDYFFLSKKEFQLKIKSKEIVEWDFCLDNYYGYIFDFPGKKNHITHGLSRMTLRVKAKYPQRITTVFLIPDNKDRILSNLKQLYSGKDLLLRESLVEEELCHSYLFDKVFTVSGSALDLLESDEMKKILSN